jgi:hypothetical protein
MGAYTSATAAERVKARVHHDELGLAQLHGFGHPLETAGVGFGGIAAHDED